jgi:DNA-binding NtrC family response regulator
MIRDIPHDSHRGPGTRPDADGNHFAEGGDSIALAADLLCPVLITGDSAQQREAVARLIHRGGRFVKVDCATFEDTVFDDATVRTFFFDPIDAMSAAMQARLLVFLDQQATRSTSDPSTGLTRVVAGSDGSVMRRVEADEFSSRLFYRLNVIHLVASELGMAVPT